jgi:hypothetical protein
MPPALKLSFDDRRALSRLVQTISIFRDGDQENRRIFLEETAGISEAIKGINLSKMAATVAPALIARCEEWGELRDRPGVHALKALLEAVLETGELNPEDSDWIANFLQKYHLTPKVSAAVAPRSPDQASQSGFTQGYALIIGIAGYPDTRKLPISVLRDATDLFNVLSHPDQGGYQVGQIRLLLDQQATQEAIRSELEWLENTAGPDDTVLLFYSGHGGRATAAGQVNNYLLPYDVQPRDLSLTAISDDELTERLGSIKSPRLLAILDCCYAGGLGAIKDTDEQPDPIQPGLAENSYERLAQGSGRVIIASSRSSEVSHVLNGMNNSLFTHTLLQAINGAAYTRGDGLVRVLDVFNYLSEEVPKQAPQHPQCKGDFENNFPIALVGGRR